MPLLSGLLFSMAKGSIDPYFEGSALSGVLASQFRLENGMIATNALMTQSHDLAVTGTMTSGDDRAAILGLLGGKAVMPVFCVGATCPNYESKGSFRNATFRNGVPWTPNTKMFVGELMTPGKFLTRARNTGIAADAEYYHSSWQNGNLSAQQGDAENSLFGMGGMMGSLLAMHTWQGHGPMTYKGKAPNGGSLKYKDSYYTDAYNSHMRIRRRVLLTSYPEVINVSWATTWLNPRERSWIQLWPTRVARLRSMPARILLGNAMS